MENIRFYQPHILYDALKLLNETENNAILAGGTDILLEIRRKEREFGNIIDLSRISELQSITEDNETVTIGSMVTFTDLIENPSIINNFKGLYECAKTMAAPQIRNIATIGGNIMNAAAAADSIPCVISLEGQLVFESVNGIRQVRSDDYFGNYKEHRVKNNEILTKIVIPKKGYQNGFYKLGKRNALAIARINTAVSLKLNGKIVEKVIIALGAVGRYPFRVKEIENLCVGKDSSYLESDCVLNGLEAAVFESIKNRPTMPFKKEAIKGVYKLALKNALGGEIND